MPSTSPTTLPLVFTASRRGMPPTHFADLSAEERIDAVTELGLPKVPRPADCASLLHAF